MFQQIKKYTCQGEHTFQYDFTRRENDPLCGHLWSSLTWTKKSSILWKDIGSREIKFFSIYITWLSVLLSNMFFTIFLTLWGQLILVLWKVNLPWNIVGGIDFYSLILLPIKEKLMLSILQIWDHGLHKFPKNLTF